MELIDKKIQIVLEEIDFVSRYKSIADSKELVRNKYTPSTEEVLNLFSNLGYNFKYNKKENFYKLIQVVGNRSFQFNISLKYDCIELIWDVLQEEKRLNFGYGGWSSVVQILKGERPKLPEFEDLDDLKETLIPVFQIFEDFKLALIEK